MGMGILFWLGMGQVGYQTFPASHIFSGVFWSNSRVDQMVSERRRRLAAGEEQRYGCRGSLWVKFRAAVAPRVPHFHGFTSSNWGLWYGYGSKLVFLISDQWMFFFRSNSSCGFFCWSIKFDP